MHTPCFLDSPICPVAVFALSLALFTLCRLRGRTLAAVSQSIEAASASASAATSIQLSVHLSRVASFLCTGAATELQTANPPQGHLRVQHRNAATHCHRRISPPHSPHSFWNFLVWNNLPLLAPVAPAECGRRSFQLPNAESRPWSVGLVCGWRVPRAWRLDLRRQVLKGSRRRRRQRRNTASQP
ncbi:hypothetical protein EDB80DRAFT_144459 [Ilyonectria destructans]|nr:hypothetical protein EDB80DRAFT_144459 [Ilyonectria destructans]